MELRDCLVPVHKLGEALGRCSTVRLRRLVFLCFAVSENRMECYFT